MTDEEKIIYRRGYRAGWSAGARYRKGHDLPSKKEIAQRQKAWLAKWLKNNPPHLLESGSK